MARKAQSNKLKLKEKEISALEEWVRERDPRHGTGSLNIGTTGVHANSWSKMRVRGEGLSHSSASLLAKHFGCLDASGKACRDTFLRKLSERMRVAPENALLIKMVKEGCLNFISQRLHDRGCLIDSDLLTEHTLGAVANNKAILIVADCIEQLNINSYQGIPLSGSRIRLDDTVPVLNRMFGFIGDERLKWQQAAKMKLDVATGTDDLNSLRESYEKSIQKRMIHLLPPFENIICDINSRFTVSATTADWFTTEAIDDNKTRLHEIFINNPSLFHAFPLRIDTATVVLSSDKRVLLGWRSNRVRYDRKNWAVIGEHMDRFQDCADDDPDLVLHENVVQRAMVHDPDETTLPQSMFEQAERCAISVFTNWRSLQHNLCAIVKLNHAEAEIHSRLPMNAEHDAWAWRDFDIPTIMDLVCDRTFVRGEEKISSWSKYSLFAALCHVYTREKVFEWVTTS